MFCYSARGARRSFSASEGAVGLGAVFVCGMPTALGACDGWDQGCQLVSPCKGAQASSPRVGSFGGVKVVECIVL